MNKVIGISIMIVLLLASFLSFYLTLPPSALPATSDQQTFSAERALIHVKVLAEKPHSTGTKQNQIIRDYLVSQSEALGLKVETQEAHTTNSYPGYLRSAYVENVIAKLPGSGSSKALLVMSHYDSQPNTFGAGDDGAGVAAMLEVMRILSQGPQLENDVIFLFTDGEEMGLMGARAFVEQHNMAKEVGVLLNFEGRGNSGPSLTFEVNPDNGWVIEQYAKAAPYPMANSMSYEIYKMLPNDTDFTVFKNDGIAGLNFGFIDGFVNYHSMTDSFENLNPNSLQHHGSYMLSLSRHFGSIDLSGNTKAADLTFFNPIGHWLISYPASWDVVLVGSLLLIFLIWFFFGIKLGKIRLLQVLVGLVFFILALATVGGISWAGQMATKGLYPHYQNFYASNFYNSHYYLGAALSLGIFVFLIIYRWLFKKNRTGSLLAAVLIIEIIGIAIMYQKMPTAVYLFTFPLLYIVVGQLVVLFLQLKRTTHLIPYLAISTISFLPAIFLWVPVIYNLFLAFSIDLLLAPVILLVLLMGMGLPLFGMVVKARIAINSFLFLGFIFILLGHFTSQYNAQRPLQSDLIYALDLDQNQAFWVSSELRLDDWKKQIFKESKPQPFTAFYPRTTRSHLITDAPTSEANIGKPSMHLDTDTLIGNERQLALKIGAKDPAAILEMMISKSDKIVSLQINDRVIEPDHVQTEDKSYRMVHYGLLGKDIKIKMHIDPGFKPKLTLISKSVGLSPILKDLPDYIIPGTGFASNTCQAKQTFTF
ncbi:MAG: M20/M25/M40 family metallo-hydrolase [Cyclobacteriaceae bacterium]